MYVMLANYGKKRKKSDCDDVFTISACPWVHVNFAFTHVKCTDSANFRRRGV